MAYLLKGWMQSQKYKGWVVVFTFLINLLIFIYILLANAPSLFGWGALFFIIGCLGTGSTGFYVQANDDLPPGKQLYLFYFFQLVVFCSGIYYWGFFYHRFISELSLNHFAGRLFGTLEMTLSFWATGGMVILTFLLGYAVGRLTSWLYENVYKDLFKI